MLVYLDQKVWSSFARRHEGSLRLIDALRSLVDSGRLLCPIALPHVLETAAWPVRHQATAAIEIMAEFSQGVCWRDPFSCMRAEEDGERVEPSCDPAEMLSRGDARKLPNLVRTISQLGIQAALRGFMLQARGSKTIQKTTQELVTEIGDAIESGRFRRSAEPDPQRAAGPLSATWAELCRDRVADPQRAVHPGDVMDMVHVMHAAMADYALLDRVHANTAKRMKHWNGWVDHQPEALTAALSEMALKH